MKGMETDLQKDGFTGIYYPAPGKADRTLLVMLGDSNKDPLVRSVVKYMHQKNCNVLSLCAVQKPGDNTGYHNFPMEHCEAAVHWALQNGSKKVGICGGSTSGMLALIAGSLIPELSLILAFCPGDFVMQGFYQGKKDGMKEWPAQDQSTVSWRGRPLPYQPFYLEEKEYWNTFWGDTKKYREPHSLGVFRHSEAACPVPEDAFIKVEKIRGTVVLVAAEDDSMWESAKYCRRMEERLRKKGFSHPLELWIYPVGTHFVFPQGMMKALLPIAPNLMSLAFASGRKHPAACRAAREDIDRRLTAVLQEW